MLRFPRLTVTGARTAWLAALALALLFAAACSREASDGATHNGPARARISGDTMT